MPSSPVTPLNLGALRRQQQLLVQVAKDLPAGDIDYALRGGCLHTQPALRRASLRSSQAVCAWRFPLARPFGSSIPGKGRPESPPMDQASRHTAANQCDEASAPR
jgi:hypothetical protein